MKVLQDAVGPDQSSFLKGRYLSDSIWQVINIMHFGRMVDTPVMAMFVDVDKAFDRVEWEFLFFCAGEIKNGTIFIQWIKYTEHVAKIQHGGCQSNNINIRRGVWQRCPLSPFLFNLVIEVLVLAVRQSSEISGVSIEQVEHKIILYADDVTFLQHPIVESFVTLKKIITLIASVLGYKVNEQKMTLLDLGIPSNEKECISKIFPAKWKEKGIWYLGITISVFTRGTYLLENNIIPLVNWMKSQLEK